jgi:hypothetical protein
VVKATPPQDYVEFLSAGSGAGADLAIRRSGTRMYVASRIGTSTPLAFVPDRGQTVTIDVVGPDGTTVTRTWKVEEVRRHFSGELVALYEVRIVE